MEKDTANVPYFVYEAEQARHERTIKRFIVVIVISTFLLFASNAVWLWAWMQYDYVSEETTSEVNVDGKDGVANYIGNDGDINNGIGESKEDH